MDVPATASGVPRGPGSLDAVGSGIDQTDPAAAMGLAPGGSVPDLTQVTDTVSSAAGVGGLPAPENPVIPGITGLHLAGPGELTPGMSSPLPSAGVPGMPASDQVVAWVGLPGGSPDPTVVSSAPAALPTAGPPDVPFGIPGGGIGTPDTPAVPSVSGVRGATGFPSPAVPDVTNPAGVGLTSPLPVDGVPALPAGDPGFTGRGLPAVSPDLTAAQIPGAPQISNIQPPNIQPPNIQPPDAQLLDTAAVPFAVPDAGPATPEVPGVPQLPRLPGAPGLPAGPDLPASPGLPDAPGLPSWLLANPLAVGTPTILQPPVAVPDPITPLPTPSTPYYFLAESSPYRPADGKSLDSLVAAALSPVPVAPPQETFRFLDRPEAPPATTDSANPAAVPIGYYPPFDVNQVRRDFPILTERVNGKPLIWLDNAATTQKPQAVIDRLAHFYRHENSNIHRAAHELAARATDAYEGARKAVARFIGAGSHKDIVFVRGATEAINLVAKSWGKADIHRGDEIIISHLEHHANIVRWQQLISETGAVLRVIPVDDSGQILLDEYTKLLSRKTKLVAVTQVSNALGTVTPVEQIVELGHRAGARVLIDGAQSVPHLRVNMQALGADLFVFSGHKIFAPTGIGVLYGRPEVLESMPPWEGGGNMIVDVTFEKTTYQEPPARFEAGTGNIADAVGLAAALDYVTRIGLENIAAYEHSMLEYATPRLRQVSGLKLIGTARDKASVMSFVLDGYRTEEVGAALNQEGIAVRSGHHCAQPILRRFGVETTVRPSLAFYNTRQEIDVLVAALHRLAADRGRR